MADRAEIAVSFGPAGSLFGRQLSLLRELGIMVHPHAAIQLGDEL